MQGAQSPLRPSPPRRQEHRAPRFKRLPILDANGAALLCHPRAGPQALRQELTGRTPLPIDVCVLAGDRIGDRLFQAPDSLPFGGGTNMAVASDLIEAPIDFYAMMVGIEKLHGDLASRPAAPVERDRNLVLAQPISHAKDLFERPNLERDMMQLDVFRLSRPRANQRNGVVVRAAPQASEASRLHVLGVDVGNFESQDP